MAKKKITRSAGCARAKSDDEGDEELDRIIKSPV
jgi:hypothetical protein